MTTYEVRTRFNLEPEDGDDLGPKHIANLVAIAIRRGLFETALVPTEGVTVTCTPRGARVHATPEKEAV